MDFTADEFYGQDETLIRHYGTPRHSGRYPWGSGRDEESSKRNRTLLDTADELRRKGLKPTEVAQALGMTTTEYRSLRTIVRNEERQDKIHMATRLKEKGLSNGAIAERLRAAGYSVGDRGTGESHVRDLLKPMAARKATVLDTVTDSLRKAVDEKDFIDVGSGVEYQLNTTSTMLRSALQRLKDEGYKVHNDIKIEQATNAGKFTNYKVLTKGDKEWGDVVRNRDKITQINDVSTDGGKTVLNMQPPLSISSKRVGIRYAEQGGADADGVIYVRPGVKDVELGGKRYAQVRVMVDGSHYLKGMAVYKDDLPDGVDLLFNTNKSDTGNKLDAMKALKRIKQEGDVGEKHTGPVDQDNPFGASISRQIGVEDHKGGMKVTSVMNIVNQESDWDKWSKNLSSQMLSKQQPRLAKEQLDHTYTAKKSELEGILALTNPSVKRKLLTSYADGVDTAAVHLKAAHLPRQKTQVLLPVSSMKEHEVYAPNFNDGERVALVRFPHGGTFEIPELTVNNRNPGAKKLLGNSLDAVGIHPEVAKRLSGADFDGDTVLVIPNNLKKVKSTPPLEGLKDFDPKTSYPPYEGMKKMTDHQKGLEMGKVSNLITDMTIRNATEDEIARAVRHSMVVIDAEKHNLDFRRSERDNGILALKKKYQSNSTGNGAATLISRARSEVRDIPDRKERAAKDGGPIDPKTGEKVYVNTGKTRVRYNAKGEQVTELKTISSTRLAETRDAHTLSSGTVIEKVYADHSNRLKALANQARKASLGIKNRPYSPSAKAAFKDEVTSLDQKIRRSIENAPLERQAQVIANATVRAKLQDHPELKNRENKADLKRVKAQALSAARARTGADKQHFDVTEQEWAAIQAGAVTAHKLDQILTYADLDKIKLLATPRQELKITPAKVARAKSLHAQGYTWAEIAQALGVSVSTVQKTVNEGS
jgi:hypothetical protein